MRLTRLENDEEARGTRGSGLRAGATAPPLPAARGWARRARAARVSRARLRRERTPRPARGAAAATEGPAAVRGPGLPPSSAAEGPSPGARRRGRPGGRARRAFRSCGPRRDLPRAHAAILPPLLALSKWPPGPAAPASPPGPGSGVRGPPPRAHAPWPAAPRSPKAVGPRGVPAYTRRGCAAQPALCSPESAAAARLAAWPAGGRRATPGRRVRLRGCAPRTAAERRRGEPPASRRPRRRPESAPPLLGAYWEPHAVLRRTVSQSPECLLGVCLTPAPGVLGRDADGDDTGSGPREEEGLPFLGTKVKNTDAPPI